MPEPPPSLLTMLALAELLAAVLAAADVLVEVDVEVDDPVVDETEVTIERLGAVRKVSDDAQET
ncbi:MAG: hypothetical protein NTU86_08970 [Burkholderiales bacterium]|nr:hypothetical protein [Burkholderiales bacterium]